MSTVREERIEIAGAAGAIRAVVVGPARAPRACPVVVAWPDIFGLTGPHLRLVRRLAGHGFVVVAPAYYGRQRPGEDALEFERDRQVALDSSAGMELPWIDEDTAVVLRHAATLGEGLGVWGFCHGGHVALRAALDPRVWAASCFYATGVHRGVLGAAQGTAGTLERVGEIKGEVLLVWGREDPHIPAEGRRAVHEALGRAGVRYEFREYGAEHAFARDEGARYDPAATDDAFLATVALFRRTLGGG